MTYDNQQSFKDYKDKNYNKELNNKLMKLIKDIPTSNGSRYFEKIDKNIAIITDEFMYNYYKDSVNLIYVNYFKYKEIIENNNIDMFMFVTCWSGIEDNDWRGGKANGVLKEERVYEVIELCKLKGIPTIFQSIEDPSNYDVFINIAKKCDYIFTTDSNKMNDYKNDCNNKNVYLTKFGINPLLHNPIGMKNKERLNEILFAGSWMKRYPHRGEDMKKIFDGVLSSGKKLDIIDRNFHLNKENYFYPQKYIPYTSPAVNHEDLQKIHKLYDWIINLNSIKYSPTMCAMRCYEAQGLGNCILSNYSIAVNDNNPNIFIIHNESEVEHILNGFSEEEIYKHQVYGIRNVMSDQCVFDRISFIVQTVDPSLRGNTKKKVLVVSNKITSNIVSMFDNQVFEEKYLVEEEEAKKLYNQYDFITFFKEDYYYEEYYLQDMINGFKYTDSDYVTKDSYYSNKDIVAGIEHNYVSKMRDKYKSIFDTKAFSFDFLLSLNKGITLENGYSIDHFELNMENYEIKTLKVKKLYKNIKNLFDGETETNKRYKFSVIVAVYNNGKHLLNKCFNSLRRSSMFNEMEIILVDDGSDDKDTFAIVERLNREYKNVKVYKFPQGGSGSPSRPRNMGVIMASTDFVTFLDPDNEAVNDGYAKLYKEINDSDYDMLVGNVLKASDAENIMNYCEAKTIENTKEHVIDSKFAVISIQGTLIRKSLIVNNNLKMVDGAIGEDTLYFIELMLNSKKVKVIDEMIHIYYAALSTSETNNINENFFRKSLLLEREMSNKLETYGLKDIYMDIKFDYFYRYWYMKKLQIADKNQVKEITNIMLEIIDLYDYSKVKDQYIKNFLEYARSKKYDEIERIYF